MTNLGLIKEEPELCPRCNGEGCKLCKLTGWLTAAEARKWARDNAPPGDNRKKGKYHDGRT